MICPSCDAILALSGHALIHADEADTITAEAEDTARKEMRTAEEWLSSLRATLSDVTGKLNVAHVAKTTLAELDDDADVGNDDKIKEVDDKIQALTEKKDKATTAASDLELLKHKAENADEITTKAKEHHLATLAWDLIAQALAPDGLPAEILAQALKPVNDHLRQTATATGWKQVSIQPDITITVDGRPYPLMSESAKWRVDAAIADAISHLAGFRLLILDRLDVLDLPGRKELITWVDQRQEDYDTVLLLGTLKALPARLPEGFESHWLENGEILPIQDTA